MARIYRIDGTFERLDELLTLIRRAFAYMDGRIDPPSSMLRLTVEMIATQAAADAVFVAEERDRLVGCVFCESRNGVLYLSKLAVCPDHQRRGLGRALIRAAESEARRRRCDSVELETRIELVENHAAFAAMGFTKTAEKSHPGFDRPTSITMRRKL